MANTNGPFGLQPTGETKSANPYGIVPGTTKIFIGDPVKKDTAGTTGGLSTCDIAGATGAILGVVQTILDPTGMPVGFYPGGSAAGYTAVVLDSPDQEFLVQEDSDSSSLAQADMGLNANLVSGTGNESTGLSGWMIDSTSKATTATHQVRLIRLAPIPGNAIGAYAKYIVRINNHANAAGTGSVGV